MKILGRPVSQKFADVFKAATEIATTQGKSISFRYTREHPNPTFRTIRGIKATVPEQPNILGIYLNETLCAKEFELVAVHELCHVVAENRGFGYKYGLTHTVSKQQLDLWENVATCIGECFTHLTVYRLTEDYGYSLHGFDDCVLDEIRDHVSQRKRLGTAAMVTNAVLHISHVFQQKYALSTLDLHELETLLNNWDQRILALSHKAQLAIPNVDLFSVVGCFDATIALRNTIGTGLGFDLSACIHYFNPQTGLPE